MKLKATLYTAPACPFCVIVKKYLERNEINFREVDVSKSKKAKDELLKKSGQESVPVLDAGGIIIIGYNLGKMNEALGLK